jgi:hypothetical protein
MFRFMLMIVIAMVGAVPFLAGAEPVVVPSLPVQKPNVQLPAHKFKLNAVQPSKRIGDLNNVAKTFNDAVRADNPDLGIINPNCVLRSLQNGPSYSIGIGFKNYSDKTHFGDRFFDVYVAGSGRSLVTRKVPYIKGFGDTSVSVEIPAYLVWTDPSSADLLKASFTIKLNPNDPNPANDSATIGVSVFPRNPIPRTPNVNKLRAVR